LATALLTLGVAGCHDFSQLSSDYGKSLDLGGDAPSSSDLAQNGTNVADLASAAADLAPVAGNILGAVSATLPTVNLTIDGPVDWAHFGYPASGQMDHKASVNSQISYYTTLSGNGATVYTNNTVSYSWSDGTLTPNLSGGTTTGMFRVGVGDGFAITVPATTTPQTLKVYVGVYHGAGRLTVSLSDNSAAKYVDNSLSRYDDSLGNATYTLTFNASRNGQTLQVIWSLSDQGNYADGNVTLQSVSLH
jgi:hypothetical protein